MPSFVNLKSKKVIVAVGGGIAAYKVCELVSTLFKSGVEVRIILTKSAQKFITPLTLSTLSRYQAYTDENFWQPIYSRPLHIELGEWADLIVIAPLTANTLAKLAYGMADNLLTNTVLASTCPVLLAPAMNTDMWEQVAVQRNWQQLLTDSRFYGMETGSGLLACDRIGAGRMAEAAEIFIYIQSLLYTQGKRYLDPVRFIGNPSTGKMGLALAQAALHRGAKVILVHCPASWEVPLGVEAIPVITSEEMQQVMLNQLPNADIIIMSAAVADVKPRDYSIEKLPKRSLPENLPLIPVPDIVAEIGNRKQPHQYLIGFAAQTGDIVKPAREKLQKKKLDAIVANPIDQVDSGFGSDNNQAVFLDKSGREVEIPTCSKLEMAHYLFDFVIGNL
jgi:phosphopantothenoylcysteine decarboxylase/phosphopantothenate--cysteine ligase